MTIQAYDIHFFTSKAFHRREGNQRQGNKAPLLHHLRRPELSPWIMKFFFSFVENNSDCSIRRHRPLLVQLSHLIPHSLTFNPDTIERLKWKPNHNGEFSVKVAQKAIRGQSPKVPQYKIVWFPGAIPKLSFLLWLLVLEKIPTRDRLQRFKIVVVASCLFCGYQLETADHLFFTYPYSQEIWRHTLNKMVPAGFPSSWHTIMQTLLQPTSATLRLNQDFKVVLSAAVYHVWLERSRRHYEAKSLSAMAIAAIAKSALDR